MTEQYHFEAFAALRLVSTASIQRAGELMFQVVCGVVDADTLQDLTNGARQRADGVEMAAVTLVISAMEQIRKDRENGNAP
jgi:hypothetical protein